jgi:hypothetical protein
MDRFGPKGLRVQQRAEYVFGSNCGTKESFREVMLETVAEPALGEVESPGRSGTQRAYEGDREYSEAQPRVRPGHDAREGRSKICFFRSFRC